MGKSKRRRKPPAPSAGVTAAQRRPAPRQRPRTDWVAYWPVAFVGVLILAALTGLYIYSRSAPPPAPASSNTTAQVVDALTHLDPSQTAAVGSGGVANPMKPTRNSQPLNGPGGHPDVLYIGAEYCPYCAAERWSLVIALSRFGTFSGLELTQSSSTDIYPNTPTLTFAHATYQSSSIDFEPVETSDRNQRPLRQPTSSQSQQFQKYDGAGSIPFVDIANRHYAVGAGYLPDNLQGLSWTQVAQALADPSSPLAKQILGNANWITAAICQATGDSAGTACSIPQIKTLEGQLGA